MILTFEECKGIPVLLGLLTVILKYANTTSSRDAELPGSKYELYKIAMEATLSRRFTLEKDAASSCDLKQATEDLLSLLGSRNELYANGARIFNEDEAESCFREQGGEMGSALIDLWNRLRKHDQGVPFVKVVSEGTPRAKANFQFKHKSLQEAMATYRLINNPELLYEQISDVTDNSNLGSKVTDSSVASKLNTPSLLNVYAIGGAELGRAMVEVHPSDWDFSKSGLNKAGFEALIHLYPKELGTSTAALSVVGLR